MNNIFKLNAANTLKSNKKLCALFALVVLFVCSLILSVAIVVPARSTYAADTSITYVTYGTGDRQVKASGTAAASGSVNYSSNNFAQVWYDATTNSDNTTTITLQSDIYVENTLRLWGSKVTLDLNGYILTHTGDAGSVFAMIDSNASLTIKDSNPSNTHANGVTLFYGTDNEYVDKTITGGVVTGGKGIAGYSFKFIDGSGWTEITDKTGGGAVFLKQKCSFTLQSGTITGNTAQYGGGVLAYDGYCYISGGCITNNMATIAGGGVLLGDSNDPLQVYGNPVITGNYCGVNPDNIYLCSSRQIKVVGELTEGAQIGVTLCNGYGDNTFLTGFSQTSGAVTDFISSDQGYSIVSTDQGSYKFDQQSTDICTVTVKSAGNGTVNHISADISMPVPKNSTITISGNTVTINGITVTAYPDTGYEFSSWTGAVNGSITTNTTITAIFRQLNTVLESLRAEQTGTLTAYDEVSKIGSAFTVTAVYNTGEKVLDYTDYEITNLSTGTSNTDSPLNGKEYLNAGEYEITFSYTYGVMKKTTATITVAKYSTAITGWAYNNAGNIAPTTSVTTEYNGSPVTGVIVKYNDPAYQSANTNNVLQSQAFSQAGKLLDSQGRECNSVWVLKDSAGEVYNTAVDAGTYYLSLENPNVTFTNNKFTITINPQRINLADSTVYKWTLAGFGSELRLGTVYGYSVNGSMVYYSEIQKDADGQPITPVETHDVYRSIVRYRGEDAKLAINLNNGKIPVIAGTSLDRATVTYGGSGYDTSGVLTGVYKTGKYTTTAKIQLVEDAEKNYVYYSDDSNFDITLNYRGMTVTIDPDGKSAIITKEWYIVEINNGLLVDNGTAEKEEYKIGDWTYGDNPGVSAPKLEHGDAYATDHDSITFTLYTTVSGETDKKIAEFSRNEFAQHINSSLNVADYILVVEVGEVEETVDGETIVYQSFTRTFNFTVGKATLDVSGVKFDETLYNFTYDGTDHKGAVKVSGTYDNTIVEVEYSYAYNTDNSRADASAVDEIINAGDYTVTARFNVIDPNYNAISTTRQTNVTVAKATYDMTGVKYEDKTQIYNRTPASLYIEGELPTGLDGVKVTVSYTCDNTQSAIKGDIGTYMFTAVFTGSANYEAIPNMTATLTITEYTIDLREIAFSDTNYNFTYDGTNHYDELISKLRNDILGQYSEVLEYSDDADEIILNFTVKYGTGTESVTSITNAGTYTITAVFTPKDSNNVKIISPAVTAVTKTITVAKASYDLSNIAFKAAPYEIEYESVKNFDRTDLINLSTNDDVTFVYEKDNRDGTYTVVSSCNNVGTYRITATVTRQAENNNNYTATSKTLTATLTVTPKEYSVENVDFAKDSYEFTFDGYSHNYAVTGSYETDIVEVNYAVTKVGEEFTGEIKNAGKYVITATFELLNTNYELCDNSARVLTVVINPVVINPATSNIFYWELVGYGSSLRDGDVYVYEDSAGKLYYFSTSKAVELDLDDDNKLTYVETINVLSSIARYRADAENIQISLAEENIPNILNTEIKRSTAEYCGAGYGSEYAKETGLYTTTAVISLVESAQGNYIYQLTVDDKISADLAARGIKIEVAEDGNSATITKNWYIVVINNGLVDDNNKEYSVSGWTYGQNVAIPAPKLEHGDHTTLITFTLVMVGAEGEENKTIGTFGWNRFAEYINKTMPAANYSLTVTVGSYTEETEGADDYGVTYQSFERTFRFTVGTADMDVTSDELNGTSYNAYYTGNMWWFDDIETPPIDINLYYEDTRSGVWVDSEYDGYYTVDSTFRLLRWGDSQYLTLDELEELAKTQNVLCSVDTYTVYYRITGANYKTYGGDNEHYFNVVISNRTVDVTDVQFAGEYVGTYNGSAHNDAILNKLQLNGITSDLEGLISVVYTLVDKDGHDVDKITNAGTYKLRATITLKNSSNYQLKDGSDDSETVLKEVIREVSVVINKAVYDMSGVEFNGATFTYNGEAHAITITGNLPTGVTVAYWDADERISGYNSHTDAGSYVVYAVFTGDNNNYEPIERLQATLVIDKADYVFSGLTFDSSTGNVYKGSNYSIAVNGINDANITVNYYKADSSESGYDATALGYNSQKNAGTYEVYALIEFAGNSNYNRTKTYLTATLGIVKADFDLSEVKFANSVYNEVYTGSAFNIALSNVSSELSQFIKTTYLKDGKTVTECVNAGTYDITATIEYPGDENHNAASTTVTTKLVIAKANYDLSKIEFDDGSFAYDGEEHSIAISGTYPETAIIVYRNASGSVADGFNKQTESGIYTVYAMINCPEDENHNAAARTMYATLTIKSTTIDITISGDNTNGNEVEISSPEGFDPGLKLEVTVVNESEYGNYVSVGSADEIQVVYDVVLKRGDEVVQPANEVIIKLLIPESLAGKEFKIYQMLDGKTEELQFTVKDGYAVITTATLGEFIFVEQAQSLLIYIIILGVVSGLLSITLIGQIISRKKKNKNNKAKSETLASVAPLFLAAAYPAGQYYALIGLACLAGILLIANLIYFLVGRKKNKQEEVPQQSEQNEKKVTNIVNITNILNVVNEPAKQEEKPALDMEIVDAVAETSEEEPVEEVVEELPEEEPVEEIAEEVPEEEPEQVEEVIEEVAEEVVEEVPEEEPVEEIAEEVSEEEPEQAEEVIEETAEEVVEPEVVEEVIEETIETEEVIEEIAEEPTEEVIEEIAEEPTEEVVEEEPVEEIAEEILEEEPVEELPEEEPEQVEDIPVDEPEVPAIIVDTDLDDSEEEPEEEEAPEEEDDNEEALPVSESDDEAFGILIGKDESVGLAIIVRYKKSFTAKLIQSSDELKGYYTTLKNEILSYEKAKSRVSWNYDSINAGRNQFAKFVIRGKTLCLYLALNPDDYEGTKYKVVRSFTKKYADVPCLYRIKNARRLKYAHDLIKAAADKLGLQAGINAGIDYYQPYDTTESLVQRGLIKELISQEDYDAFMRKYSRRQIDKNRRDFISASEVNSIIDDEVAMSLIEEADEDVYTVKRPRSGKKGIINVDTLSANFDKNDIVNIETLKAKKLISASVGYVKVLARGSLSKPLIVEAQDFSLEAIKMIALTGGKVKKV